MTTPFALGGTHKLIKTDIQEYERIDLGKKFFGIIFQNKHNKIWHVALENCGALIGSDKSKAKLIKKVKSDVSTGDPKIMKEQIEQAKTQIQGAILMENKEWFSKFRS